MIEQINLKLLMQGLHRNKIKKITTYSYPNGRAITNVITGTMLMKAHANVADVY